jgi:ferredoxin
MAMGGLHIEQDHTVQTIVLVGTAPTFWDHFSRSSEYVDGGRDPIDNWSRRVVPEIANAAGGISVVYPFGGPPYAPFLAWAKQTGETFDSPVGMLVHHRAGMMISYRGAIVFAGKLPLPLRQPANPCDTCASRACVTACPVDALSDQHFYNVPSCKAHISSVKGTDCVTVGCSSRLACPVSQSFDRPAEQTAFHMRAFKGV